MSVRWLTPAHKDLSALVEWYEQAACAAAPLYACLQGTRFGCDDSAFIASAPELAGSIECMVKC